LSREVLLFVGNHVFRKYLEQVKASDEKKEEIKEAWKEVKKILNA
jgi:hypothetical protein